MWTSSTVVAFVTALLPNPILACKPSGPLQTIMRARRSPLAPEPQPITPRQLSRWSLISSDFRSTARAIRACPYRTLPHASRICRDFG
ncbi:hypothetical protein BDY21DRAFT_336372 [Lineolata rhizophorae]|uniref:Secreted protein n=1 Tax=Lineolata rhizophorae TaxID=578093 RepID=A0A6A6P6X4_9PEZI|nr:hypothetical protein BDY21DRAFT_336372 [Lineolata rhizophorae]